jgi:hypothetical protein
MEFLRVEFSVPEARSLCCAEWENLLLCSELHQFQLCPSQVLQSRSATVTSFALITVSENSRNFLRLVPRSSVEIHRRLGGTCFPPPYFLNRDMPHEADSKLTSLSFLNHKKLIQFLYFVTDFSCW